MDEGDSLNYKELPMADTKRNALAAMAKKLSDFRRNLPKEFRTGNRGFEFEKVCRIVAELANVTFVKSTVSDEVYWPDHGQAFDALIACRAIAEEGANNG